MVIPPVSLSSPSSILFICEADTGRTGDGSPYTDPEPDQVLVVQSLSSRYSWMSQNLVFDISDRYESLCDSISILFPKIVEMIELLLKPLSESLSFQWFRLPNRLHSRASIPPQRFLLHVDSHLIYHFIIFFLPLFFLPSSHPSSIFTLPSPTLIAHRAWDCCSHIG